MGLVTGTRCELLPRQRKERLGVSPTAPHGTEQVQALYRAIDEIIVLLVYGPTPGRAHVLKVCLDFVQRGELSTAFEIQLTFL
jgi:hypothetical protein